MNRYELQIVTDIFEDGGLFFYSVVSEEKPKWRKNAKVTRLGHGQCDSLEDALRECSRLLHMSLPAIDNPGAVE